MSFLLIQIVLGTAPKPCGIVEVAPAPFQATTLKPDVALYEYAVGVTLPPDIPDVVPAFQFQET